MAQHGTGISLAQYESIKAIAGVEVVAPLSFIGNVEDRGITVNYEIKEHGFYYTEDAQTLFDGNINREVTGEKNDFFSLVEYTNDISNSEDIETWFDAGGWSQTNWGLSTTARFSESPWSMVAVDSSQEAKILQKDEAISDGTFFQDYEEVHWTDDYPIIPPIILLSKYYLSH